MITGPNLITDGLVLHYDFLNTKSHKEDLSLINVSDWTIGSGSTATYPQNGVTAENVRKVDTGPWGDQNIIWESIAIPNASSDGGWNTDTFPIDNTQTYRFSVWINRKVLGTGNVYLGSHGYGTVNGIRNLADNVNSTNPYFYASSSIPEDTWLLYVGHVHPHTTATGGTMHVDSGRWNTDGTKYGAMNRDYIWLPESTTSNHRSYLYYSTLTATTQQFCYPRVDLCDGTEPTLQEIISNKPNDLNDLTVNKNHSTIINGPLYSGGGLIFDGIKDYVDLGSSKTFAGDLFSIEFVFNANKMPAGAEATDIQNIIGNNSKNQNIHYLAIRSQKIAIWNINSNGGGAAVSWYSSLTTLVVSTTYHVVVTSESGYYKIYLNGILDSSIPFFGDENNSLAFQWLGTFGDARYFDGTLYSLKAYNRVLSPAEVSQNYNSLKTRFGL